MNGARCRWLLRRWRQQIGWVGVAGLVVTVIATVSVVFGIAPREVALEDTLRTLMREPRQAAAGGASSASGAASAIAADVPGPTTFTVLMRRNTALAAKHDIALRAIDFSTRAEAGGKLMRYSLQYTLEGGYAPIRDYLVELEQLPGVRIETLSLVRNPSDRRSTTVQVRLSYLQRAGE
ncbi:hypothetical protein [Pararobbsia alpina]|uniref:Type II secretion system protein M n=1 Tax=Pararobbsia alpina TaxID=621374 RepID=A0A6S7AUR9_9BURK|nr:hypothetical protein [Pararobbsia alpina]CAB3776254.1 hypothetical protein LMG28138_00113 [Pararobbsia alpina]